MKLPDPEQFNFKECEIGGDKCWLITPKDMSTSWDDENARFRSCIVRQSDNFVVSQGFGKFTNFGEKPLFQPWDNSWKIEARHKLDGSLLIVSKYKGELIIRTRGTVDARQMANGHEIDLLIKKYPEAFNCGFYNTFDYTYLFEWTTPSNIIVLREHDEPTLTLVGMVNNISSYYVDQKCLDIYAVSMGVNRPQKYEYDSIEECIMDVAAWKGKEGVVLYSPDGQTLKKIKADEYCELHKLATGIKGINQVLDVFMASPKFMDEKDFYKYIETTLDFEIAEKCKDFIGEVCKAYTYFINTEMFIRSQVDIFVRPLETRKDQAMALQQQFSNWSLSLAFAYLDNRGSDDKMIRKALENILAL